MIEAHPLYLEMWHWKPGDNLIEINSKTHESAVCPKEEPLTMNALGLERDSKTYG